MRVALYVAEHPGDRYDQELARAQAFCEANGFEVTRRYPIDFLQNKGEVSAFLAAANCGVFDVVVAPNPECFPSRFLSSLLASGTGLACYATATPRSRNAKS